MKRSVVIVLTADSKFSPLNLPCNKVEFRSMPTNVGTVWFNIGAAAVPGYSYPLDIGDGKEDIYITNLSQLFFTFDNAADKVALVYESGL